MSHYNQERRKHAMVRKRTIWTAFGGRNSLTYMEGHMGLVIAEIPGLLGTRPSLMLDVVVLAMFLVLPVLVVSISVVRRGNYQLHKTIQLVLGIVLLLAVVAFELDMR